MKSAAWPIIHGKVNNQPQMKSAAAVADLPSMAKLTMNICFCSQLLLAVAELLTIAKSAIKTSAAAAAADLLSIE